NYYKLVAIVLILFMIPSLGNFEQLELSGAHLLSVALSAITVPVAGLYFALNRKHFLTIVTSTALCAMIIPYLSWDLARIICQLVDGAISVLLYLLLGRGASTGALTDAIETSGVPILVVLALHAALINFFFSRTLRSLRKRSFAV